MTKTTTYADGWEGAHDVEEDGHVHLLAAAQPLLLETETLDLVEVRPGPHRGHVVGGHPGDGVLAAPGQARDPVRFVERTALEVDRDPGALETNVV